MPFEKPTALPSEKGGARTLLLTAFVLSVALLTGVLGSRLAPVEEASALHTVMESEAVCTFLHVGDA